MAFASKTRIALIAAALAVATAAAAVAYLRGTRVETTIVRKEPMRQTIVVTGRVLAPAKVAVGATITGRVATVAVDEGQRVAPADLLVAVETAELEAALAQATSLETAAQTRIRQWRDVDAPVALQQLKQAEANLVLAQRSAERQQRLAAQGFVGAAAVDEALRALAVAASQVAAARATAEANADSGVARRLLEDQLAAARAASLTAAAKLAQTRIVAPAAGIVLERSVEPGDIVQPGKTLFTVALDGPARLTALIDEKHLAALAAGQRARVAADAFPAQPFDAVLEYLSPGVDVQRGTVEAKLGVPRPPPFLRADMTVSIEIEVADRSDAVVLPSDVVRESHSPDAWVAVVSDGRVERRSVTVGARSTQAIEIVKGLAGGERVVVTPDIAPGTRVRARD